MLIWIAASEPEWDGTGRVPSRSRSALGPAGGAGPGASVRPCQWPQTRRVQAESALSKVRARRWRAGYGHLEPTNLPQVTRLPRGVPLSDSAGSHGGTAGRPGDARQLQRPGPWAGTV
jgi:hypothetical protein